VTTQALHLILKNPKKMLKTNAEEAFRSTQTLSQKLGAVYFLR
jgi:hypothetical protein